MKKNEQLHKKKVLVVSHVYTTVPVEDLKEYLLNQDIDTLLYIKHPLFYKENLPGSSYFLYKKGKLIKSFEGKNHKLPSILKYLIDSIFTVVWTYKTKEVFDVAVCLDNLNTIAGLLLKLLLRVRKVIFYTIDYVPNRFQNALLNSFYHFLDRVSVVYADKTWVLTQRMIDGRKKLHNIDNKNGKQTLVPIGIWFDRIKRKSISEINPYTLVYAGGLLPHQGVQLMLEALPRIKEKIPSIKFKIIGIGDYQSELEMLTKKLKLENTVEFLGYFKDHREVENILTSCTVGVGLYSKDLDIWSYYADPSKMKSYLAAGLPVLTTDVTYFSKIVKDKDCGVVVDYAKDDVAKKTIALLSDRELYKKRRENAISLAKTLDWNEIFTGGFSSLHL